VSFPYPVGGGNVYYLKSSGKLGIYRKATSNEVFFVLFSRGEWGKQRGQEFFTYRMNLYMLFVKS
jgi:hypothetical protein